MFKIIKKIWGNHHVVEEDIELIRKSKYFDEKYYRLENPKVKGDLCRHYYYYGWKEGKSPSFDFSTEFYLKNYKDVEDAGINPLIHYLKFGKAENRVIEKDNGLSLKKVYEKFYGCAYFYKTYIHDTEIRRLNLFFDEIDDSIFKLHHLLQFVSDFCRDNQYQLRIIYYMADFELLKKCLEQNHITLPSDLVFLNLKSSNYLEVGLHEKYVCTSWKNARALLNTASMSTNIYFYLNELDTVSLPEYYQISNICTNKQVVCLVENASLLKSLKKCQLKFNINHEKLREQELNQLYCDFSEMFIVGVEILNDAFLTGSLDPKRWMVNIVDYDNDFKFHFDTDVRIRKVSEIDKEADLIFQLSYQKQESSTNVPTIFSWIEEFDYTKSEFINILEKKSSQKILNAHDNVVTKIDNYFNDFKNNIKKLKKEG